MNPPGSGVEKYVPLEQEKPSRGLRDFFTILFKHRSRMSVIFLATVSGLAAAFFSEYTSESFSTPGTAGKQLAMPVLTTIRHRD